MKYFEKEKDLESELKLHKRLKWMWLISDTQKKVYDLLSKVSDKLPYLIDFWLIRWEQKSIINISNRCFSQSNIIWINISNIVEYQQYQFLWLQYCNYVREQCQKLGIQIINQDWNNQVQFVWWVQYWKNLINQVQGFWIQLTQKICHQLGWIWIQFADEVEERQFQVVWFEKVKDLKGLQKQNLWIRLGK